MFVMGFRCLFSFFHFLLLFLVQYLAMGFRIGCVLGYEGPGVLTKLLEFDWIFNNFSRDSRNFEHGANHYQVTLIPSQPPRYSLHDGAFNNHSYLVNPPPTELAFRHP